MPHYTLSLDDTTIGQRLDTLIAQRLPAHSRVQIQGWIKDGYVTTVAGRALPNASFKSKTPLEIVIDAPEPATFTLAPDASLTLPILYEDDDLLVINKPTGLAVHPGAGNWQGTLVHALLAHTGGQLSDGGQDEDAQLTRPGIVHRLDKDTSGAMVVAKNNQAHFLLAKGLEERTVKRHYWALVWGMPNPLHGTIDTYIGRDARNRQKMSVQNNGGGKHAVTHYTTQQIFRLNDHVTISLVLCVLDTGRTHQIRVHMTHIGHAVLADPAYGERLMAKYRTKLPSDLQDLLKELPGQALHARELSFLHPMSGTALHFVAPPPPSLQAVIDYLERYQT